MKESDLIQKYYVIAGDIDHARVSTTEGLNRLRELFAQSRDIPTKGWDEIFKEWEEMENPEFAQHLIDNYHPPISKLGKGEQRSEQEGKKACGYCGNVLRNPVSIESGYCDSYCYENKDKI